MPVDPRIQRRLDEPLTTPTDLRFASKRGYAQPPATGPVGETCASCRHRSPTSCSKRDWYCDAVSLSRADRGDLISLATAACGRWVRTR